MKLKALIFDVDGTLADNEEAHRCAFNAAFRDQQLDWNWSQAMYARLLRTAGGKERLGVHIDSLDLNAEQRAALKARIGAIHHSKTVHYTRTIESGAVPLRDGIKRLLDEAAAANVSLAIATATTLANIEALLRAHLGADALSRFEVIGYDDQVPRKKPAPDIYQYVLRELSLRPDDCVAIEDSANGVNAATAAGIFTVVTPSYWTRDEDFTAADLIVPSLGSMSLREIDAHLQGGS
jgi:HAD superfamily hydrolase (TIGR01509 family)